MAVYALALAFVVAACGGTPPLPGPTPQPRGAPPAAAMPQPVRPMAVALYGRVFEHTDVGVVAAGGLPLVVTGADLADPFSVCCVTVRIETGADGGYRADVNRGVIMSIDVGGARTHVLPCLPFYLDRLSDEPFDLHVASPALLSAHGPLPSMPRRDPMVRGRVFERTAQGDQPIRGALVEHFFLEYAGSIGATVTGPDGRFEMCGYNVWDAQAVRVTAQGFRTATRPLANDSWDVTFELARE